MNTRPTTVAGYLLTRLAQAGVASVFGVPGDDNLGLLDAITARPSLAWIGMATEQGAGCAADGYARLRGLGAALTTFGVGELSALNAIAGAYAESVPVVHIVGAPALAARTAGLTLHHNLPGRDYGHFARIAAEVTAAQADLRPPDAAAEIDRVLSTALRTSRPVYLTIPADVAGMPVSAPTGRLPDPVARAGMASPSPVEVAPCGRRDQQLTVRNLWASVQRFVCPGDLLMTDGTAELTLPDGAQLVGQSLWASTGWTVPAALGASLAAPDRRVVLILRDSAMRQTAAELGTLLGQGLVPVVVVLSNGGDTTEHGIGHPGAEHDDTPAWDWTALPEAVAPARGTVTLRAHTDDELARSLNAASRHAAAGRPVLIEAVLSDEDVPPLLRELPRALAHR